ncbi:glycosyltransferase [Erythrobacter sp.]|uniref:glycosyltransferase n=1 Tax=Erythrobacter sp. TaxID=1042 RepID=UPI003C735EFA
MADIDTEAVKTLARDTKLGKPLILHISGDFPDPLDAAKTPVIRRLVDLTANSFEHHVVSINRTSSSMLDVAKTIVAPGPLRIESQSFEYGEVVRYSAPPHGLRHRTKLLQLGQWVAGFIDRLPRRPAFIIGHKLTIEGIVAHETARLTGIPYGLSIQGNTDLKILAARRDLKSSFAEIFHQSRAVFPFAPWALQQTEARIGQRSGPTHLLPCATELDTPIAPRAGGDGLVSVFHLHNYRGKNLAGMVEALRLLRARRSNVPKLEIVGGGSERDLVACRQIASGVPEIRFVGPCDRDAVRQRLHRASALVLPSIRESFGLVFIEALFAGTPIIYPAGTAIDGYFDDADFALSVNARSAVSIADAIERAVDNEAAMKLALSDWQQSDDAGRFSRERIAQVFSSGLEKAMSNRPAP